MKKLTVLLLAVLITGCSSISSLTDMIPSRWDANQAKIITDLQQDARHFNCAGDQLSQLNRLAADAEWFELYSASKGTKDVAELTKTVENTIKEFQDRIKQGPVSPIYCDLKQKLIIQQTDIVAKTVQGRF